jgi:hypothetical protein
MESKLGLYDLLSRLVPGGFLLWGLGWIASEADIRDLPPGLTPATEAVAFILISYVAGLVAHALGDWLIEPVIVRLKGRPSERYLSRVNEKSSASIVAIRDAVEKGQFGTSISFSGDQALKRKASHRAFRLALAMVEEKSSKVQALQAQYGLHRSLAAANALLTVICIVESCRTDLPWAFSIAFATLTIFFCVATYKWGFNLVRGVFETAAARLNAKQPNPTAQTEAAGVVVSEPTHGTP